MVHQEVLPEGPKDSFGTDNPLTSDLWSGPATGGTETLGPEGRSFGLLFF